MIRELLSQVVGFFAAEILEDDKVADPFADVPAPREEFPPPQDLPPHAVIFLEPPTPQHVVGHFMAHMENCREKHPETCGGKCAVRSTFMMGRQVGYLEGRADRLRTFPKEKLRS